MLTLEQARKIDSVMHILRLRYAQEILKNLRAFENSGVGETRIWMLCIEINRDDKTNVYRAINRLRKNDLVVVRGKWYKTTNLTDRGKNFAEFLNNLETDKHGELFKELLELPHDKHSYLVSLLVITGERASSNRLPLLSTAEIESMLDKWIPNVHRTCGYLLETGFLEKFKGEIWRKTAATFRPTKKGFNLLRFLEKNFHLLT